MANIYKQIGASNHTEKERQQEDYYATEPCYEQYRLSIESKFVFAGSGTTLLLHPKSESSGML